MKISVGTNPPHNTDAERCVIGCLLLDDRCLSVIDGMLTGTDFYDGRHAIIYNTITDMATDGKPVDAVTVAEALQTRRLLSEAGGVIYLFELLESVPHTAHADYYARLVREKAQRRRIIYTVQDAIREAERPDTELSDILSKLDLTDIIDSGGDRFTTYDAQQLAAGDFELEYLIPHILAKGIPSIISGSFKTLKTSIAVDLDVSLNTGSPFLNKFRVTRPYRSAFMSGESGLSALQSVYRRVANSKGWSMDMIEHLLVTPDLPHLSDSTDVRLIERFIREHGLECLLIDPAYLALDLDDKAGNLFAVGRQLRPMADIGQRTGCTIIIVHHNTKASSRDFEPAELSDIQWAGFAEFSGQWLLLSRREKYDPDSGGEHRLWLNVGGRPGHSGLWAVDVTEGRQDSPPGRRWDVLVKSASQARTEAAQAAEEGREDAQDRKSQARLQRDCERLRGTLRRYPDGETRRQLKAAFGLSGERFQRAFTQLEADGEIEQYGQVTKGNNRRYDVFRLIEPPQRGPRIATGTAPGTPQCNRNGDRGLSPMGESRSVAPCLQVVPEAGESSPRCERCDFDLDRDGPLCSVCATDSEPDL